jgi:TRAP-type C4-dicarboxylate transport system permease small subunit
MKKFHSALDKFCHGISYVSLVAVLFAMMVTVIDIILKLTVHVRILGNMELVELSMILMMYLSFGTCQMENGHVRVDMFVNKFPPKGRCITNGIIQGVCTFFCILLVKQSFKQVSTYSAAGTGSQILHVPYAPFSAIMCFGFIVFAITLALSAIEQFMEVPHAQKIEM